MTTKIDWCDETSNPFHGCYGPAGARCFYCYAERFAKRHGGNSKSGGYFELKRRGLDPFAPLFDVKKLAHMSKRWETLKSPRRIFLGSMGDLGGAWPYHLIDVFGDFHELGATADAVRHGIIGAIAKHPRQTFLILTKQPENLAGYDWPSNVQIGVSVSTPDYAAERIPVLLGDVDAAVSWVSIEPLLGGPFNTLYDENGILDWVVIGAETGPGANPKTHAPNVAEAVRIVELCRAKSIPVFVKDNLRAADPSMDWPREFPELS